MILYVERLIEGRNVLKEADMADVREWLKYWGYYVCTDSFLDAVMRLGEQAHDVTFEKTTASAGPQTIRKRP